MAKNEPHQKPSPAKAEAKRSPDSKEEGHAAALNESPEPLDQRERYQSKKRKKPVGYRISKSFRRNTFRKKLVTTQPRSLGGHR